MIKIKDDNLLELYTMKLGQQLILDNNSAILRVPGGWIYRFGEDNRSAVYVPFDNEFMLKERVQDARDIGSNDY